MAPVIASQAKQSSVVRSSASRKDRLRRLGLLRRFAPRNDDSVAIPNALMTRGATADPMTASVTPVILTHNEEANLARTLEGVAWARDIVVVDSFSDDGTLAIAARFENVRVFQRRFDSHANQWNFAIEQTNIASDWILALDADYVAPPDMRAELARATRDARRVGFLADFRYCVFGRPLRASLYPAHVVLFRRGCGRYAQFGHTQRLIIDGEIGRLAVKLDHDDRKPLGRWLEAQAKYARLEAEFVAGGGGELRRIDRLRKTGWLAPIVVLLHVLLVKRCLLEGWRGWFYALQRTLFEILFCLAWLEREQMRAHRTIADDLQPLHSIVPSRCSPPSKDRRPDDRSRPQRVSRRLRRVSRARRRTRRGGGGGAFPAHQTLGRLSRARHRLLSGRSRRDDRGRRRRRDQFRRSRGVLAAIGLSRRQPPRFVGDPRAAERKGRARFDTGAAVPPISRAHAVCRASSASSIISRISIQHSPSRRSRRRWSPRSTVSATLRARPGASGAATKSRSRGASCSRIRSESSIRR